MTEVNGSVPGSGSALSAADAALAELRGGVVGDAAVELLRRLGRQCTRSSRTTFPPPVGHASWSDDAVDHLLADMFARADKDKPDEGHKFVLNCYARATDGPSLERLFLAAIENFLKDEAKKTERGKLRRRLTGLFQKDGRFSLCTGDRWGLDEGSREPWQGDLAVLERAAFAIRGVEISSWNESGPTPQATVSALLTIAEAVLVEAGGSVRTEDLARVIQGRFRLLRVPILVSVDDEQARLAEILGGSPGGTTTVTVRAELILDGLTEPERRLLPVLAEPKRWKTELGIGSAVAEATGEALIEKVRLATIDDTDHDDVVIELARLCVQANVAG